MWNERCTHVCRGTYINTVKTCFGCLVDAVFAYYFAVYWNTKSTHLNGFLRFIKFWSSISSTSHHLELTVYYHIHSTIIINLSFHFVSSSSTTHTHTLPIFFNKHFQNPQKSFPIEKISLQSSLPSIPSIFPTSLKACAPTATNNSPQYRTVADSPPPLPSSPAHSACRCISSVFLAAHSPQTTLHPRDPATADRTAACRTSASHGRKVALPARFYHSKPLHSMSTARDTR